MYEGYIGGPLGAPIKGGPSMYEVSSAGVYMAHHTLNRLAGPHAHAADAYVVPSGVKLASALTRLFAAVMNHA